MIKLIELRKQIIDRTGRDQSEVDYFLTNSLKLNRTSFLANLNQEFEIDDELNQKINRLETKEPVQYILGFADFFGRQFVVNENVLIPRIETGELIERAIKLINNQELRLLDVGTGTGAIAISLKLEQPQIQIEGLDISLEALKVARENSFRLDADVKFYQSDLLENAKGYFDIIISNPPYIADGDQEVEEQVNQFEPHLALYAGVDGLDIYRRLIPQMLEKLTVGGIGILEIGYKQADKISNIIQSTTNHDISIELHQDYSNLDRIIIFKKSVDIL